MAIMSQFNDIAMNVYQYIWSWLQETYDNMEFTRAGLYIYLAAFMLLILPLTIFALEYLGGTLAAKLAPLRPTPPPTTIKEIRIYPIKSCRGFKVEKTKLLKTGLDLDRNWMFVDAATMKFLTIRQISEMTLIDTAISDKDELVVSIRNQKDVHFTIPAHPTKKWLAENTTLHPACEIWGQKVDGYVYSEEMTKPFSAFFDKDVRLVFKGPTPRLLTGNAAPEVLGRTETTKFADLMPVQISNQKSIDELNFRLKSAGESPISIERFRPNIVVEGEEPWYEDSWKTVRINMSEKGFVTLDVAARCARCQVPNVDPDTAVKHKKQPWNMLMKYRRIDKGITFKPCFGMLCCPREEGQVAVGDELEILEVTEKHLYIKGM
jgi:uncharacterized protein YcbX